MAAWMVYCRGMLTVRKRFFRVAARVARAARAAATGVSLHVVTVGAYKVGHRDRVEHPADAAAFFDDRVRNAPVAGLELDDVLSPRKLELVLRLRKALLGQLFCLRADAILVACVCKSRSW